MVTNSDHSNFEFWPMHRVVSKCPVPIESDGKSKFWRQIRIQRSILIYIYAATSEFCRKIVFFFRSGGRAWRPANAAKFGADFCQIWFPKQRKAFRSNFPWFSFNKRKCGAKHSPQTGQMVKCLDTRSRVKIWCYFIEFWSLSCIVWNHGQDPSQPILVPLQSLIFSPKSFTGAEKSGSQNRKLHVHGHENWKNRFFPKNSQSISAVCCVNLETKNQGKFSLKLIFIAFLMVANSDD